MAEEIYSIGPRVYPRPKHLREHRENVRVALLEIGAPWVDSDRLDFHQIVPSFDGTREFIVVVPWLGMQNFCINLKDQLYLPQDALFLFAKFMPLGFQFFGLCELPAGCPIRDSFRYTFGPHYFVKVKQVSDTLILGPRWRPNANSLVLRPERLEATGSE